MSDSSDEVDTFGTGIYECRKLEDHDWDNYLENNYDVTNILAYHWKEKGKDERAISSFSKLIRISTASTNMKVKRNHRGWRERSSARFFQNYPVIFNGLWR